VGQFVAVISFKIKRIFTQVKKEAEMKALDEEWVEAWKEKINQSVQYRQAALTWEWPLS
jgi:hypothetical protein